MNKKFKRVVEWEEPPNYEVMITGIFIVLASFLLLFFKDKELGYFSFLLIFLCLVGLGNILEGLGKNKKEYFLEVK